MKLSTLTICLFATIMGSSTCRAQVLNDLFSQYFERGITITPGAGNAKDANAAIHTIDPWPAYAGYTYIPGDGRRAVNSIERMYRVPNPFSSQQQMGFGTAETTGGSSSGPGGGPSSTVLGTTLGTPVQPVSSGGY
jgi:hypothetical protein